MEEEEPHSESRTPLTHTDDTGRSVSQLIRELLHLLLVLIWHFLVWLFKRFLKGVLWCMQALEDGTRHLNEWWQDKNTQEKVAETKAWLKRTGKAIGHGCAVAARVTGKGLVIAARATWKGLKVAAIATGRGIVRGIKATIQGIIHLRPTIKRMGRAIAKGARAFVAWLRQCRRGARLSSIRRQRRHEEFRRQGGMKGWMTRTSHGMRNNIAHFMEEDQEEAAPDAVTEDDIMEEVIEKAANDGKRPMKIGKSIMSHAKNFMDVE